VLNADGSVQCDQSINGGAITSSSTSGVLALASAWNTQRMWLGSDNTGGASNDASGEYIAYMIARGSKSMADFREWLP
jgi:hypothetical protein